nr:Gag-Pol polyprotein [Tanacetum cinerariifolium]
MILQEIWCRYRDEICNFSLWKLKMKAIIRNDKCLVAIGERPTEVMDDSKWDAMDGNAISNLHLALADGVLSSIMKKKSAKEIWDHLAGLYEAKSLHNKILLKRKLYALRMSESTSISDYERMINPPSLAYTTLQRLGNLPRRIVKFWCWNPPQQVFGAVAEEDRGFGFYLAENANSFGPPVPPNAPHPLDLFEIDDIVSDAESVDTPLVSPFLDSDNESDDGEALNTIMVKQFASRDNNFVAIVRNIHVIVGSFTYVTTFTVFEDIEKYIGYELFEVVMGKPFKDLTHLEDDCSKGPEYQVDKDMKEWITCRHVNMHDTN